MTTGDKIQVTLKANHSYGTRSNPVQQKQIDFCDYREDGSLNYFKFKGGKTEYRICGKEIYSITGPVRTYKLL